jgi:dipeptidase
MRRALVMILASSFVLPRVFAQECFTVVVGKNASADGSVLIAHNEDDMNEHNFVDLHKVPRRIHAHGERQVFLFGRDSIDEVRETYSYFWITGSQYNEDQYLNEWGVAITSNSSRSNVENGNGRIEHDLRRIVIQRARTAKEAVRIAGMLVERYGYASSGRIYSIADPNEAWIFEVANGKFWIARRVPDDQIVIVPNYYVIDDFHGRDTANYLVSPGLIEYAEQKGWYDPRREQTFNFRKAFGRKDRLDALWNIGRKWVVLDRLAAEHFSITADFPFSVKPKRKVDLQTLMLILGNHYENTPLHYDTTSSPGSPHHRNSFGVCDTMTVCNVYTDFSLVVQLRGWLPTEIGNVMWIAPRYACIQPFIPWYFGVTRISPDFEKATIEDALANVNNKNRPFRELYPTDACWAFDDMANRVDSSSVSERDSMRKWRDAFQAEVFEGVMRGEREAGELISSHPENGLEIVTRLSNDFADRALRETRERLAGMKVPGR